MTAYGQPALRDLRRVVRELKGGDPMTPVTILMPKQLAGIVARRFLGRGLGDGHQGVAAICPTTATRLAQQLAQRPCTPRPPSTRPVLAAAWRAALTADAGFVAKVAHPATVQAPVRAGRDLLKLDDAALAALMGVQLARPGPRPPAPERPGLARHRLVRPARPARHCSGHLP